MNIEVAASVMVDHSLTSTAKLIYGVLRNHEFRRHEAVVDQRMIAEEAGVGLSCVAKSLLRLSDRGHIVIRQGIVTQPNRYFLKGDEE